MKNLLMNLYYDNYTVSQAIDFITRCYDKSPTEKMINKVKSEIKSNNLKEWE